MTMSRKSKDPKSLPRPPDIERRVILKPLQWLFLGVLLLIPLLALFGVFGPRVATVAACGDGIEVRVQYPSVLRYRLIETLAVEVKNARHVPFERLTVRIDRAFLEHFSEVLFTPEPTRVTDRAYEIE